jgi:dihydrolipoamide dehydrogenase
MSKWTETSGTSQAEDRREVKVVCFENCIIAAGSRRPSSCPSFHVDPRIVDSTGALLLLRAAAHAGHRRRHHRPRNGDRLFDAGRTHRGGGNDRGADAGSDRDLVKVWEKKNAHRFDAVMLNTRVTGAEATPDGIKVSFEGAKAPAAPQTYDRVLVAVGRTPNGRALNAEAAGLQ